MLGKEVIGGGNRYSGYNGVPGGRGGNGIFGKPGNPGNVSASVGANSFRVAAAESRLESEKLMKITATTRKRDNAIFLVTD